jgi:hypothetical protein
LGNDTSLHFKKSLFLSLVLLAGCHFLLSQNKGRISGTVIDSLEKTPIDFATVSIFKVGASRLGAPLQIFLTIIEFDIHLRISLRRFSFLDLWLFRRSKYLFQKQIYNHQIIQQR